MRCGKAVPPSKLAAFTVGPGRTDPVDLIAGQAFSRIPALVPVRHGRMMASPAAFYRGAALPMAADLAGLPNSGVMVQLGGDAHLLNFGLFALPERDLMFDMTDFDETLPGPFEWDVKRLAASLALAARQRKFAEHVARHISLAGVSSYADRMRAYAVMTAMAVYYSRVDVSEVMSFVDRRARPYLAKQSKAATHHDALDEFGKAHERGRLRQRHLRTGHRRLTTPIHRPCPRRISAWPHTARRCRRIG